MTHDTQNVVNNSQNVVLVYIHFVHTYL